MSQPTQRAADASLNAPRRLRKPLAGSKWRKRKHKMIKNPTINKVSSYLTV
jgi:hypothetical protein